MERSQVKVGMKVYFGRPTGEKTLGIVRKLNPTKAKVETLEVRGHRDRCGEEWGVPYSLLYPADQNAESGDAPPPIPEPELKFTPFDHVTNLILEALVIVYCGLSPENLSCDGELPHSQIVRRRNELQRQLKGLQTALGRNVSEMQVYKWDEERQEYQRNRTQKQAN